MRKYRESVYKLNVQILSQTPFTKKGVTTQRVYKVKQRLLGDFELGGEDEMEPMSGVTFSTSLRIMWSLGMRFEHLCVYKAYPFIFIFLNDRSFS